MHTLRLCNNNNKAKFFRADIHTDGQTDRQEDANVFFRNLQRRLKAELV
jgi:hypothetical protein